MFGWELVQSIDPAMASKMKAVAPNAQVGSAEAKTAFQSVVDTNLDFNSSDGIATGKTGKFAGKSLDQGQGGRSELLKAKLMVSGMDEASANKIVQQNAANKAAASTTATAAKAVGAKSAGANQAATVAPKVAAKSTTAAAMA